MKARFPIAETCAWWCAGAPVRWGVRRTTAAYTLVEITVVVMVMGILAAAAAPKYVNAQLRFRCQSAARRIAADINYARNCARSSAANQSIRFFPLTESYSSTTLPSLDRPGTLLQVSLGGSAYPANISTASFGGSDTIAFDIFGKPSATGTVVVSSGSFASTVTVSSDGLATPSNP